MLLEKEELTYWELNILAWTGIKKGKKRDFFPLKLKRCTWRGRRKDRRELVVWNSHLIWWLATHHVAQKEFSWFIFCVCVLLGLSGGGNSSPTGPNALPFCNRPINFPTSRNWAAQKGKLFSDSMALVYRRRRRCCCSALGRSLPLSFFFSCCWTFVSSLNNSCHDGIG
jgi:hypothetical protein